jgi:hypothetical protein
MSSSRSSSINSSSGGGAYSPTPGRDSSVAASSRAPSRPASQPAPLSSSGLPLQSMSQSHGSRGGYAVSQGVQSQAPSNPAMPMGAEPLAQSGSYGVWRARQGSGGGEAAGAGSAVATSQPGTPAAAPSGSWRASLGSGGGRSADAEDAAAGPSEGGPKTEHGPYAGWPKIETGSNDSSGSDASSWSGVINPKWRPAAEIPKEPLYKFVSDRRR